MADSRRAVGTGGTSASLLELEHVSERDCVFKLDVLKRTASQVTTSYCTIHVVCHINKPLSYYNGLNAVLFFGSIHKGPRVKEVHQLPEVPRLISLRCRIARGRAAWAYDSQFQITYNVHYLDYYTY